MIRVAIVEGHYDPHQPCKHWHHVLSLLLESFKILKNLHEPARDVP